MRARSLLLALLLSACAAGGGGVAAPEPGGVSGPPSLASSPEIAEAPYVVLVSIDGFRHDYLDRQALPAFRRLEAAGVRAESLVPVFPTKTFANHYSIVTGMYTENHGIVANDIYDPAFDALFRIGDTVAVRDARWYGGEPIWVTAERQGVTAGTFFWPGSEAPILGSLPTYTRRYDGSIPDAARVDSVLAWLSLPAERRPHLLTLYFSVVDDAGHRHGPDSPETARAVRAADGVLGRLLDGIRELPIAERVSVVVVSDHGMADVSVGETYVLEDHVELEGVRSVNSGPFMQLFFAGDSAREDRALAALRGLSDARVFRRAEIPEALHLRKSARAGDVLIVMDAPHQIIRVRRQGSRPSPGVHGYPSANADMHGIFLAAGPEIRAGVRVPAFENVHIHPFVARLLGIRPARGIDGRMDVLEGVLEGERAILP